jgi:predicted Zn-dependent peptidase
LDGAILERLQNGLAVIVDPVLSVDSAFCGLMVDVGSTDEPEGRGGISHFLEHMAFKGTSSRSYRDIAEAIESIGGELNAFTGKNRTFYYAKTLREHAETGISLLADIIRNSIYDQAEIDKEREVILQEYYMGLDDPDDLVFDNFSAAAFKGQPLGRPIIGAPESIRSITREDLVGYVARNYTAGRMALVVSGNVEPGRVFDLAAKHFSDVKMASAPSLRGSAYTGGENVEHKDLDQAYFVLGYRASPIPARRDVFAEVLLASILGGGMSSRLFQEIRENKNLVYSISAGMENYADTGVAYISASTEKAKLGETLRLAKAEIARIQDGPVSQAELARAKEQYRASLLMGMENMAARARALGSSYFNYGRLVPTEESLAMMGGLGAGDVLAAARRMFSSPETLAVLGRF